MTWTWVDDAEAQLPEWATTREPCTAGAAANVREHSYVGPDLERHVAESQYGSWNLNGAQAAYYSQLDRQEGSQEPLESAQRA